MRSFDQLLGLLSNIPDPRRAEGKLYELQHVLLFSILAVVTGGSHVDGWSAERIHQTVISPSSSPTDATASTNCTTICANAKAMACCSEMGPATPTASPLRRPGRAAISLL